MSASQNVWVPGSVFTDRSLLPGRAIRIVQVEWEIAPFGEGPVIDYEVEPPIKPTTIEASRPEEDTDEPHNAVDIDPGNFIPLSEAVKMNLEPPAAPPEVFDTTSTKCSAPDKKERDRPNGWDVSGADSVGMAYDPSDDESEIDPSGAMTRGQITLYPRPVRIDYQVEESGSGWNKTWIRWPLFRYTEDGGPQPRADWIDITFSPGEPPSETSRAFTIRVGLPLPESTRDHNSPGVLEPLLERFAIDLPPNCHLDFAVGESETAVLLSIEGTNPAVHLKPGPYYAASAVRPGAIQWRLLTGTWESIEQRLRRMEEEGEGDVPSYPDMLFEEIKSVVMRYGVGGVWPRCPIHGRHPLVTHDEHWRCPHSYLPPRRKGYDPPFAWEYGSLSALEAPAEPAARDGEIRWVDGNAMEGVIAHGDGDIWFRFGDVESVDRYLAAPDDLTEGEAVGFELSTKDGELEIEGLFRRASKVWPIRPDHTWSEPRRTR